MLNHQRRDPDGPVFLRGQDMADTDLLNTPGIRTIITSMYFMELPA